MGKRSRRNQAKRGAAPQLQRDLDEVFRAAVELHRAGNLAQAETLYKTVLSVDATHAGALHLLGVMAHQAGQVETACALIERAIEHSPRVAQFHFNLGVSRQALGRDADAASAYRRAVELKPDYAQALENLGVALQDLGEDEAALAAYRRALAIDARSVIAYLNAGTLLQNMGRSVEAEALLARLLEITPAHAEAHWKQAAPLLSLGRLAEGWEHYEWRFHAPSFVERNPVRSVPFPKWDGSPLAGRTVLITAEQGIGDEIMFASCYAEILAQAAHCVIECDPRLVPLLERSLPGATIVPREPGSCFAWNAALPAIDCRIAAGSLPRHLRRTLDAFPGGGAHLRADSAGVARWRERLTALGPGPAIGISWRGGQDARAKRARSLALAEWAPIFRARPATFVNLQYGEHADEIAAFHDAGYGRLTTLDGIDPLRDVDGLMSLIAALDLVISIDNSAVFMAGALGVPVWVLLPASAEWRWLKERRTSPWLPSAELFRQAEPGDTAWRGLMASVADRLAQHG